MCIRDSPRGVQGYEGRRSVPDPRVVRALRQQARGAGPVSYTHLDVYKRQVQEDFNDEGKPPLLSVEEALLREGGEEALRRALHHEEEDVEGCLLYTSRCV